MAPLTNIKPMKECMAMPTQPGLSARDCAAMSHHKASADQTAVKA